MRIILGEIVVDGTVATTTTTGSGGLGLLLLALSVSGPESLSEVNCVDGAVVESASSSLASVSASVSISICVCVSSCRCVSGAIEGGAGGVRVSASAGDRCTVSAGLGC